LGRLKNADRIAQLSPYPRDVTPGPSTGALHHVAFSCQDFETMIGKLEARGLPHRVNVIGAIGLKQVFLADPNGVLLELNFFAA
jgi:catechol 2,3-dioxygenase-like lactoylglutathione lyase family enzyme